LLKAQVDDLKGCNSLKLISAFGGMIEGVEEVPLRFTPRLGVAS
jgi:hypothetical protein